MKSEDAAPNRCRRRVWLAAIIVGAVALVVRIPLAPSPGFPADQVQFAAWAAVAQTSGVSAVYGRWDGERRLCNYPPGYIYILRASASVYETIAGAPIDQKVVTDLAGGIASPNARIAATVLKTPAILCDALTCMLLVFWISRRACLRFAIVVALVYSCVPAVIHDSAIWGQVDSVHTLLMLVSLECAARGRIGWMLAVACAAILTKAQALVLVPIWGLLTVQWVRQQPSRALSAIAIIVGVVTAVLLPVTSALDGVWQAYAGSSTYYPFTHLNGFSAWFLTNPLAYPHLSDNLALYYSKDNTPMLLGMSARSIGAITLAGVWLLVARVMAGKSANQSSLAWAARVLPLAFFALSTQMHERYLIPAIAIWAWASEPEWRWWVGWLTLGACASLNILWTWAGPPDAFWVAACDGALHRPWLGHVPGAWCSAALLMLFVAALLGIIGGSNWMTSQAPNSE
jgi:Gpi18-like mannosyltransferase